VHIITKFPVILASVLAILLAGLTVAYTANADRVVSEYESLRQQVTAAEARANAAENRIGANQDATNQEIIALRTASNEGESTIRSLRAELTEVRAERQELALQQQRYLSQIEQFIALSEQDKTLREQQQEELMALRSEVNDQSRRIIQLVDRNSDLVSELEASQNQTRALEEQLIEIRRGETESGTGVAALPQTFRARVTNVITADDGSTLIEINAGSSDRLAEEMELIAVRDGRFLGKIRLVRVDLNEAVGRVVLEGAGAIQRNDTIQPAASS
jgi:chromosome segregation ATPase